MLIRFCVKNYKCLRDVSANLSPLTVCVGRTGSGKTSFLQAIRLFCKTLRAPKYFRDELWKDRTGYTADFVETIGDIGELSFRWRCESRSEFTEYLKRRELDFSETETKKAVDIDFCAIPDLDTANGRSMTHLHASLLRVQDLAGWEQLQKHMYTLFPYLRELYFDNGRLKFTVGREKVRLVGSGSNRVRDYFDLSQAGAGLWNVLLLLSRVWLIKKPTVVCLEDLGRNLHPTTQRHLVNILRERIAHIPGLQIVASTYSPYLLDELNAHEVIVFACDDSGIAHCSELNKHPQYKRWEKEFASGEMWSLFGENWVLEEKEQQ